MKWALLALLVGTVAAADLVVVLDEKHADALKLALKKHPRAQRLLVPKKCERVTMGKYHCVARGCDTCAVIEASCDVVLGKTLAVKNVKIRMLGDTGQCGDCMSTE